MIARSIARTATLAAALLLAGCGGMEEAEADSDPSKLSAELEARASEIEARADEAVAEVERKAAAELEALKADADVETGDNADPADTDTPTP